MKAYTAEERQKFICDYLKKNKFVDTNDLQKMLDVSDMTVRRDLKKLEDEQRLLRVMGGARSMFFSTAEERGNIHYEEKRRIAKYAASLVREGDTLFLDASSTVYAIMEFLTVPVTMITNNLSICMELKDKEYIDIILTGGSLRKNSMMMTGKEALHTISTYCVDKAFLSSNAISLVHGITDSINGESEVKRAMIANSDQVYFMMDHSKFAERKLNKICELNQITELIVDNTEDADSIKFVNECRKSGVKVHCAQ